MAKRGKSTFERLGRNRLNRNQRRELSRQIAAGDPGLSIVNPNAGGVDVGNESHFAAVPSDRDPNPVQQFGCWTADLNRMADWLVSRRIDTVAVQATGVYWMALDDVLTKHGIRVVLVNARNTKNVPGRKTDVQECQWLGHKRDGMVYLPWTRLTVGAAPVVRILTDCCAIRFGFPKRWKVCARFGVCGTGTWQKPDAPYNTCRKR
jgi:hypothetical protein